VEGGPRGALSSAAGTASSRPASASRPRTLGHRGPRGGVKGRLGGLVVSREPDKKAPRHVVGALRKNGSVYDREDLGRLGMGHREGIKTRVAPAHMLAVALLREDR